MTPLPAVEKAEFFRACGRFATGITIATVYDEQRVPHGLTVNSFTSVSAVPPLVLICLAHSASVIQTFQAADYFAVNVLTEDQRMLSDRFARKGHDRFEGVGWTPGAVDAPLLLGALATLECRVTQVVTAGDHDIFIGECVRAVVADGHPLVYFASQYRHLQRSS